MSDEAPTTLSVAAKIGIAATLIAAGGFMVVDYYLYKETLQEISNRQRENTPEALKHAEDSRYVGERHRACMQWVTPTPAGLTKDEFCKAYAAVQLRCREMGKRGGFCE